MHFISDRRIVKEVKELNITKIKNLIHHISRKGELLADKI